MKKVKHLAVVAVIFDNKGRVLLTQRNDPKSKHSHKKWQFPGGGIKFGEHPIDTVRRETQEETGIEIEILSKHPNVHSHVFKKHRIHAIVLSYPAKYKSGKIDISRDPHTGKAKWYKIEKIDYSICLPITEDIIEDAKKHL